MFAPRRRTSAGIALVVLVLSALVALSLSGCRGDRDDSRTLPPTTPTVTEPEPSDPDTAAPEPAPADPPASEIAWLDTELTDVLTGETFRISDFAGRPVLVKSFAVW